MRRGGGKGREECTDDSFSVIGSWRDPSAALGDAQKNGRQEKAGSLRLG